MVIGKILKIREDLSEPASTLLTKVPSELSVEDFEIDNKSFILIGQSKSLSAIGEFIDNLTDMVRKGEILKSLTLSSLTFDPGKNTYKVSIRSQL